MRTLGDYLFVTGGSRQDGLYEQAATEFGAALGRLARAYELDADRRRDLLQDIHVALWRSFEGFDGTCSLRTWVYRVAHNVATSYVIRQRRINAHQWVSLEEIDLPSGGNAETALGRQQDLDRLLFLIQRLDPINRKVIVSYLEGMDAAATADITGLSPGNVAVRIHRIKSILNRTIHQGARDGE